jgi:hypothetical protein
MSGKVKSNRFVYYIYLTNQRAGFFSILSSVIGHLKIAKDLGFTPVIDLESHQNYYSSRSPINGTKNVFEYYFKPVSDIKIQELYKYKFKSNYGLHPENMPFPYAHIPFVSKIVTEFLAFNDPTKLYLGNITKKLLVNSETLGVHFRRGEDMRSTIKHPYPPSREQIMDKIDSQLKTGNFKRILLATDTEKETEIFSKRFGELINFQSDISRIDDKLIDPREKTISGGAKYGYELGLSVLADAFLLSKCGSVIAGYSGVSQWAEILNNCFGNRKIEMHLIYNGRVSRNKFLHKLKYKKLYGQDY